MMGAWERRRGQPEQAELSSWGVRRSYKTAGECHKAIGTLAGQPTTNSEILADPLIVTDPVGPRTSQLERSACSAGSDPERCCSHSAPPALARHRAPLRLYQLLCHSGSVPTALHVTSRISPGKPQAPRRTSAVDCGRLHSGFSRHRVPKGSSFGAYCAMETS
jgi:hypothetical protein